MDEIGKRTRAGIVVAIVGLLMVVAWIATWADLTSWHLPDGIRIFLLAVGAPFILAGILVARSRPPAGPPT